MRRSRPMCMGWGRLATATVFAATALAVVTGCGSVPRTHYYVLAPSEGPQVSSPTTVGQRQVVGVETFHVDPPYDQGLVVYRLASRPGEVGFYDYHRWAAPLGSLAALAFADSAGESPEGPAADVVFEPTTPTGSYSAFLRGRILHLEEVDHPDGQVVRIVLELALDDPKKVPLWHRTLRSETRLQAQEASQIVDQIRTDFQALVLSARAEIRAVLAEDD
ncbi:MAG: hypothetical protein AAF657_30960 [Acidobacteriota bacterium]